ncbi:MAG: alpha/beta fold hydrolase [Sciscionella sp.]
MSSVVTARLDLPGACLYYNPEADPTIGTRADDLARLLAHLDWGQATVVGGSGGAVTVLTLANTTRTRWTPTVIAHEPPLVELLPDRAERHAGEQEVIDKWFAGDHVGSWRTFLSNANMQMPEEAFDAMFGGEPGLQAFTDTSFQNAHLMRPSIHWCPDAATLRDGAPRVLVEIGEASAGQLCDRAARAMATELGVE